ncbi:DUF1835 domain-containing protein [Oscillibacter valericigenes]|uniref:DUF1835 domain-containing protein n=1 Tax=Oscillibacter valericigenes TaxID=351091 RepID=A0ABS2FSH7_9FIRM|nr:DUF3658 domain-containing protein [Oscillibacter valericigenes]MBM6849986.1 DUF1835 domain-containing protein [Oscillibacter valericigenes]
MLELCFSQSARGGLRCAQHCGGGGRKIIGVIVGCDDGRPATRKEIRQAQKQAQQKREALDREAIPLGGTAADVLGLSLGLDMEDIREPLGEARRELLRRWYDGNDEAADQDWQETLESADRLRACGTGDAVRIWVDHTPSSACGLLHAASILEKTGAAVSVVPLPRWREEGKAVVSYQGWGEVEPELFGHFLSREEPVPPLILGVMASRWRELQQENAPLRAVVNGRVRSVGADFYDGLIRKHIPEGQTKIALIIGDVLGWEKPGIGDIWLVERIRWMLSAGELRMVREDRERFYRSVVERA